MPILKYIVTSVFTFVMIFLGLNAFPVDLLELVSCFSVGCIKIESETNSLYYILDLCPVSNVSGNLLIPCLIHLVLVEVHHSNLLN